MQSESAVVPRLVEALADASCAARPVAVSSIGAVPVAPERSHLRLLSSDDVAPAAMHAVVRPLVPRDAAPASDDDLASPPLAAPLSASVSALWGSPADVLGLLAAASEHRRVVDLIWNAAQLGALQLPPALVTAMERARATWPTALPL